MLKICDMLQVKRSTMQSWKQCDQWVTTASINRVELTLEARLIRLDVKPDLTPRDFKVADFLSRQMERLTRVNCYSQTGNEVDLNPNIANRNKGDSKKPIDQLKQVNSADDFRNLFMCEFVDDKALVFPFEELQCCMVDMIEEWEDFAPFADRPFNWRPSGWAMIRHTPATAPDARYWLHCWLPVVSSVSLSITSGKAWALPCRPGS